MAIQQRRGAKADFDATKMLPGELAVTTDGSRKVYVAFAPGDAKELASTEDVEETIQSGVEEIEQKKEEALAQFPSYEDKIKELEIYKANSIISTSSGTVFHETDCAAVSPINIKLFGKGKQNTVPGNQLFDTNIITTGATVENEVITITEDSSEVYIAGKSMGTDTLFVLAKGQYKIGCSNSNVRISLYGTNGTTWRPMIDNTLDKELSDDLEVVGVLIRSIDGTSLLGTSFTVMLNAGDTLKPYEPYVGGEQSPNMNYPQKPEFLGESGSIGEKVCNSNLVNPSKYEFSVGFGNANGVDVASINSDGSISLAGTPTITSGNLITLYLGDYLDELVDGETYITNGTFRIKHKDGTTDFLHLFTVNKSTTEYIKPYIQIRVEDYTNGMTIYPCFNVGDTLYSWKPYTEQPFTALTPNGLRGIPLGQTIPDAIKNSPIHMSGVYWDSAEGQYYIADTKNENGKDVQRISEYVVDGSNEWHLYNVDYEGFATAILPSNARRKNGFCNQQRVIDEYTSNTLGSKFSNSMWIGVDSVYIYLVYNSFFDTTLEDYGLANFKAHLNENPLKIWTWLDEPIITDTTDQYDVVMNYPNTTIVNDEGAYMEVTHVKDTQKHIEQNYVSKEAYNEHENRIAELEKAIVNS